jgi:hypothetical protein
MAVYDRPPYGGIIGEKSINAGNLTGVSGYYYPE